MVKGTTQTGFDFEVDERIKSDWRVMKAIADVQSKDNNRVIPGMVNLINFILGDKEQKLLEHVAANNDGFAPTKALFSEIKDMLDAIPEIKN